MRLMLTGVSGQVGFELQRALAPLGDVFSFDRSTCDLENADSIRAAVRQVRPDVIVNPAAYTAVDKAETDADRAQAINVRAPEIFGEEAVKLGATVVHYSTDYVFAGAGDGFHRETDQTAPQSTYGRTKLAGEEALAATGARHLIFRTSWIYGVHGANFVKTMLKLARERDALRVVADQVGVPTSAALVADVTAHAVRQLSVADAPALDGVYHLVAAGETNWHKYACYVIEYARRKGREIKVAPDAVIPISTEDYPTAAKRPANSRLDTNKLRTTFNLNLPHWKAGVDHFLEQIV
jgi:dTDP-4-dehydrorhamnose reductase